MPTSPHRTLRRACAAAVLAAALVVPALLRANMADPVEPGDRVGEPSAALAGVRVERERLEIDLRPLARQAPAVVTAVYHLRNDGPARELPLVFVADALADSGRVELDGRPVPAAAGADTALPPRWRAPATTPGLNGRSPLAYTAGAHGGATGALRFRLPLEPGAHTVRVRYRARATEHSTGSPVVHWQLGYVLAPARQWAGFEGLEVRVRVPQGWAAAAEPALRRQGDLLVGAWDRLPADALALTTRAPEPPVILFHAGLLVLGLAGLLLCVRLGMRSGRGLAARGRGVGWAALPAAGLALACTVALVIAILVVPGLISGLAGEQAARGYGYGASLVALFTSPMLFLFLWGVGLIAALRAYRRQRDPLTALGRGGAGS